MKADKILGALSKPDYKNIEITDAVIEQYDADKAKVDIYYNEQSGVAYLDTDIPHCKEGRVFNFNFDVLLPEGFIDRKEDEYLYRDRAVEQQIKYKVFESIEKLQNTIETTFDPDNFSPTQEDIENETVYIQEEDSFFWDKIDHKFVRYYLFVDDDEYEFIDQYTDEDLFFQDEYTNSPGGDKWDLERLKKEQPFFHKVLTETNKLDDFLEKSNKFYDQKNSN